MKAVVAAALVNFLWQGALIGAIAWLFIALARAPRVRYVVGVVALLLMALAPVGTGVYFARSAEVPGPLSPVPGSQSSQVPGATSGSVVPGRGTEDGSGPGTGDRGRWTFPAIETDPRIAPFVLGVWLIGVIALSTRLAVGFAGARKLTRRVSEAGANVQAISARLIAALRIRATVRVVESALVKVPAVVGAFKPVVLLPAAAMSGLSMEQVEALLAHELAHVRRHDYLVNLLQSAVETLLFYHPAVWLVSRRVRQERELCCDDLALAVCSDRVAYASALADLESLRALPSPALAANGGANLTLAADGGSLVARVRRILGHDDVSALSGRGKSVAGVAILATIILLIGGQAARARGIPLTGPNVETVEADGTGGRRAPSAPQIQGPALGVSGGVVGGVQGGVSGGVQGGAKPGVAGGVQGGVPLELRPESTAAVQDGVRGGVKDGLSDYVLGAGDEIAVTVATPIPQSEFSSRYYPVKADGTVVLPRLYQPIKVAGLSVAQARQSIKQALIDAGQFESPVVDVKVTIFRLEPPTEVAPEPSQPVGPPVAVGQIVRLEVSVGQVRQAEFNKDYTVQPDGTIVVPYVGSVKAAGLSTGAIANSIASSLNAANTLPGAKVAASIETRPAPPPAPKTFSATVQGAVRMPGNVMLREDRNALSDAIAASGSFQSNAGSRIWVRGPNRPKPGPDVQTDNNGEVFRKADVVQSLVTVRVYDGDSIFVEVAPHFYVTGYVKNSNAEFNWESGMTLGKAIAVAGGVSAEGAIGRVSIERKDSKTGKYAPVKLDKDVMNTPIQPDDVIKVPKRRL